MQRQGQCPPQGGSNGDPGSAADPAGYGPGFERGIESDGYAWWYIDALSDDGQNGLTIIAMVGSVFSPYYARARRRGATDPEDHCAINVALYGTGGQRWALTERGSAALSRTRDRLTIGPSTMTWDGHSLTVAVDEWGVPVPRRLRGTIRLYPSTFTDRAYALDRAGGHSWWPIAPCSRIEVEMRQPGLCWRGDAYLDANWGAEPLESRFVRWDWSRAILDDGSCAVLYNRQERGQPMRSLGLRIARTGTVTAFDPPADSQLPKTRIWHIRRGTQAEAGFTPQVCKTLEDTPFYARSIIETRLFGQRLTAMHESLSLTRFSQPWVQVLLPFRMPRLAGRASRTPASAIETGRGD